MACHRAKVPMAMPRRHMRTSPGRYVDLDVCLRFDRCIIYIYIYIYIIYIYRYIYTDIYIYSFIEMIWCIFIYTYTIYFIYFYLFFRHTTWFLVEKNMLSCEHTGLLPLIKTPLMLIKCLKSGAMWRWKMHHEVMDLSRQGQWVCTNMLWKMYYAVLGKLRVNMFKCWHLTHKCLEICHAWNVALKPSNICIKME